MKKWILIVLSAAVLSAASADSKAEKDVLAAMDAWKQATIKKDGAALVGFHLVGSRRGRSVDMNGYHVVRLDESGRIVEGWGFTVDQDALDAFFSA